MSMPLPSLLWPLIFCRLPLYEKIMQQMLIYSCLIGVSEVLSHDKLFDTVIYYLQLAVHVICFTAVVDMLATWIT